MQLTKDAILSCLDLKQEKVETPEWGGHVYVRTMTAGDRTAWEIQQQGKTRNDIRASLAALTICDEQGNLLFTPEDVGLLNLKSGKVLSDIFTTAAKLNGILPSDVDELEKNSEAPQ
jgi:hypothetical protein